MAADEQPIAKRRAAFVLVAQLAKNRIVAENWRISIFYTAHDLASCTRIRLVNGLLWTFADILPKPSVLRRSMAFLNGGKR